MTEETNQNNTSSSTLTEEAQPGRRKFIRKTTVEEEENKNETDPELLRQLKTIQERIKILAKRDDPNQDKALRESVPGYSEQITLFENLKEKKLLLALRYKEMQMKNIEEIYSSDIQQAKSDFENDINNYNENLLIQTQKEEKRLNDLIQFGTVRRENEPTQTEDDKKPGRKLTRNRRSGANNSSYGNGEKWSNVINMSYETYSKKKRIPCSVEGMNFGLSSEEIGQDLKRIKL
ncbi:hypothetical protein NAEGRDRAFT_59028 [Naegleria gruberi]|uniref:Uncharacterized protein n=1 Tax=Naegleria gruberi TaxID=5762 RepID=D2VRM2_NAEGR|nr:uncharacterized protein NAEGRDRAFT_59028 [Naegleria gruberi]EFC40485.1 hypothetical protein NAEGRDRAFT_59028 [Naegleria gruberi]|eukprot:XP_002673229.1 hypothetical protein NAEGRDRAFT_59028 [Naegleria gruberi strain NEG-M]